MKIVQTSLMPRNREFIVWLLMILILGAFLSELIRFRFVFEAELVVRFLITLFIEGFFSAILIENRQLGKKGKWILLVDEKGLRKLRPGIFRNEVVMARIEFTKCLKMEIVDDWFMGDCLRAEMAFRQKSVLVPVGQYEKTPQEILEICQKMMGDLNKNE